MVRAVGSEHVLVCDEQYNSPVSRRSRASLRELSIILTGRLQVVIISRFLLALRRARASRAVASRPSRFSFTGLHIPATLCDDGAS